MSELQAGNQAVASFTADLSQSAWDLFNRCLHEGRLVPLKSAPNLTDEERAALTEEQLWLLAQAQTMDDLTAAAWADSTLLGYGWHVQVWGRWCTEHGMDPLPLQPGAVALHLIDFAFATDPDTGEHTRNDDGGLVGARLLGSVENRLAALNKLAAFTGTPIPGESKQVQDLMRGIRRTLGRRPIRRKEAIDHGMLKALHRAALGRTRKQVRNELIILLRHSTRMSAEQLASLAWTDVSFEEIGIVINVPGKAGRTVRIKRADGMGCVVQAIEDQWVLAQSTGCSAAPVLAGPHDKRLTRQGVFWAAQKYLRIGSGSDGGLETWESLPGVLCEDVASIIARRRESPDLSAKRNAALLLVGWHTALRRSNLVALTWADLARRPNGTYSVLIRKSKTDQEGQGRTLRVAPSPNPAVVPCPVSALESWREALSSVTGRDPHEDDYVFPALSGTQSVALSRSGRPKRLDGEMVKRLVQDLAVEAGLCTEEEKKRFGAHSLRAGFITEALRNDKLSIPEVQDVSGHARVETLLMYRREVNLDQRNASTLLMSQLDPDD